MSNSMPVICMICSQTLKGDPAYLNHMQTVHGTTHPDQAMAQQKMRDVNLPKEAVPLSKDAPPPPEFAEIAALLDQPNLPATPIISPNVIQQAPKQEGKPLQLKYRYEGNCPHCNTPVRTIMLRTDNKLIATAYCLTHEELQQLEVQPLEQPPIKKQEDANIYMRDFTAARISLSKQLFGKDARKEMKKHARSKNVRQREKTPIQDALSTA